MLKIWRLCCWMPVLATLFSELSLGETESERFGASCSAPKAAFD